MTTAPQVGRERETANSWDKFLERVKSRVSINTYTTWFQPTRLNRAEGDTLYVQIPSAVFRQVLTRTYGDIVKAVFHEVGTPNMKVQYVCTEEEPLQPAPVVSGVKQAKLDFESSDHQLNTRYTFDSFVVGKSNEFAHAASRAVAEHPSNAYSPLFLYGGLYAFEGCSATAREAACANSLDLPTTNESNVYLVLSWWSLLSKSNLACFTPETA